MFKFSSVVWNLRMWCVNYMHIWQENSNFSDYLPAAMLLVSYCTSEELNTFTDYVSNLTLDITI